MSSTKRKTKAIDFLLKTLFFEMQFHKHCSTFNEKDEYKAIYVKLQNGTFSKYIMLHSSRGLQNKHKNGSKNANSSRMLN